MAFQLLPFLQGLAAALSAGAAVKSIAQSPPKSQSTQPAPAQGAAAQAQNIFQSGVPQRNTAAPATPKIDVPAVRADQMQLPPLPIPTQPQLPSPTGPGIGDVLAATPEALAAIAPLLGMLQGGGRQRGSQIIGAQGGGAGGNLVQGLALPRRATISELLSQLPRPRYG